MTAAARVIGSALTSPAVMAPRNQDDQRTPVAEAWAELQLNGLSGNLDLRQEVSSRCRGLGRRSILLGCGHLGLDVPDSGLDGVLREHAAVQLHGRQAEVLGDVAIA